LTRAELRRLFPRQTEDHSLHRALRTLERQEYIEEFELFGRRWIALRTRGHWWEEDREMLRIATKRLRMVRTIAAARGMNPPGLDELKAELDAYKREAK
jgi:hypothetical protein